MTEKNAPEIERKFLIAYPDIKYLEANAGHSHIVQTYLDSENGTSSRVRKRSYPGKTAYTYTEKRHITAVRRMEYEREIDENEYLELLERADRSRNPIEKERYCLHYEGQMFEIDVYPFFTDRAIMELEIEDETQQILFPPEIRVIREVTEDVRYTNASFARKIPYDDI